MTIVEFLQARISEDEAAAEKASVNLHGRRHDSQYDYGDYVLGSERDATPAQDQFIQDWWPARVLAECAAKRAIIGEHGRNEESWGDWCETCAKWWQSEVGEGPPPYDYPCPTIKAFAAVYSDHPEFQEEWAA